MTFTLTLLKGGSKKDQGVLQARYPPIECHIRNLPLTSSSQEVYSTSEHDRCRDDRGER
jgi:hypothetical protein